MGTRAGIYCRISKDIAGTALGVERQEQDCRRLCAERGWSVADVYVDNDISASKRSKKERPEYQRLLEDIRARNIDAVAVWDFDRLTRRPIELEEFVGICETAGVSELATVSGLVDVSTGDGMLTARIKGAVAAEESRKIQQRISRKKLELAEKGLPSGGVRAFGYEKDGMRVRESEAQLICDAIEHVLDGAASINGTARAWNEAGVPTLRKGNRWTASVVRQILMNPRNAGLRVHQAKVIGEASWPAIIDRKTWERLCTLLNNPARRPAPAHHDYPLRGMLHCASCAKLLTATPKLRKIAGQSVSVRNYSCVKLRGGCGMAIKADRVEDIVFGRVLPLADSPTARELLTASAAEEAAQIRELIAANAEDEARLAELAKLVADDVLRAEHIRKPAAQLREAIDARKAKLLELRGNSVLERFGGNIAEQWEELTADDRRAIVQTFVPRIKVKKAAVSGGKFDPKRLVFTYRMGALAKAATGIVRSEEDERQLLVLPRVSHCDLRDL